MSALFHCDCWYLSWAPSGQTLVVNSSASSSRTFCEQSCSAPLEVFSKTSRTTLPHTSMFLWLAKEHPLTIWWRMMSRKKQITKRAHSESREIRRTQRWRVVMSSAHWARKLAEWQNPKLPNLMGRGGVGGLKITPLIFICQQIKIYKNN